MSANFRWRKKLLSEQSFLLSIVINPKKEVIITAQLKQLKIIFFVIRLILSGTVPISPSLYKSIKFRKSYHLLEKNYQEDKFAALSNSSKTTQQEFIIQHLPIISILIEAVFE